MKESDSSTEKNRTADRKGTDKDGSEKEQSRDLAKGEEVGDVSGISKWEWDLFRDALSNVNQTLRYQISLGVPLLAACVTVLNIVPPQEHQELLNFIDKWVFIPVLAGMGVSYAGLEQWWYTDKLKGKPDESLKDLYKLVDYKYHMVHISIFLQGFGLVLLMLFVLFEFK